MRPGLPILAATGAALLLSACAHEGLRTCRLRGGHVESRCMMSDPNNPYSCMQYGDVCVGATQDHDDWCEDQRAAYEESERRNRSAGAAVTYHPPPPPSCDD